MGYSKRGDLRNVSYALVSIVLSSFLVWLPAESAKALTAGSSTQNCQSTYTWDEFGSASVRATESAGYCYLVFQNRGFPGTDAGFTWTVPTGVQSGSILVVGGGGGGGARAAGGGGGGEYVEVENYALTPGATINIQVGAGGSGGTPSSTQGQNGRISYFKVGSNGLTAGGGGGGSYTTTAGTGGSGGGSSIEGSPGSSSKFGQKTLSGANLVGVSFGNAGADGADETVSGVDFWAGGGGGGAGSAGALPTQNGTPVQRLTSAATARGGNGGDGKSPAWLPVTVFSTVGGEKSGDRIYFAGGGGGGMGTDGQAAGSGGKGGGGRGTIGLAIPDAWSAGDDGTGGGGGGSGFDGGSSANGSNGGSGTVIIRYAVSYVLTLDNGSGTSNVDVLFNSTPTITQPTRTGYVLTGWATSPGGASQFAANLNNFTMPAEDETLYAVWTSALILNFDATDLRSYSTSNLIANQGRTGSSNNATFSAEISPPTFQDQHFSFPYPNSAGSYIDIDGTLSSSLFQNGYSIDFYANIPVTSAGDAGWDRIIEFSEDDGSGTPGSAGKQLTVARQGLENRLTLHVWNDTRAGDFAWCETDGAVIDGTLRRYTLVASSSGCAIHVDGSLTASSIAAPGDSNFIPPSGTTWDNLYIGKSIYAGNGYFGGDLRSLRVFTAPLSPTEIDSIDGGALTYKTLTLDPDGGALNSIPEQLSTSGTLALPATGPSRTGYIFEGWSTASNGANLAGSISPTADDTVFALWSEQAASSPRNLVLTSGENSVQLDWLVPSTPGTNLSDYKVEYQPRGAGSWTVFADGTSTATTATVTGLSPNSVYNFRVSAINNVGTSSPSDVRSTITIPGLVSFLDASDVNSYSGSGVVWADLTGRGNSATSTNSPTHNSTDNYFELDGSSDYFTFGNSASDKQKLNFSGTVSYSLSIVFSPDSPIAGPQALISRYVENGDGDYLLYVDDSNANAVTAKWSVVPYDLPGFTSVVPGNKNVATYVFDGTVATLYLNGVIQNSANRLTVPSAHIETLLGATLNSSLQPTSFLDGKIYAAHFFDSALTLSQVLALAAQYDDAPGAPTIDSIDTSSPGVLSVSFSHGVNTGTEIVNYQYSTDGGSTWRNRASGTVGSPLVINSRSADNVLLENGVSYDVKIRAVNTKTGEASNGTTATVVNPIITSQPQNTSMAAGSSVALSVSATGNGVISYQWQSSTDGTNWTNVGTNSATYTSPRLTYADDGIQYRVRVTNTYSGQESTNTSSVAAITVGGAAVTSGDCTASVGDPDGVTISATANGGCLVKFLNPGDNYFFVPGLVSSLQAYIVGGGGGGGGAKLGEGGGGGGGGGASRLLTLPVTSSQVLPLTVGEGGAGGNSTASGQNGTASSFSTSYTVPGGLAGRAPTSWPGGGGKGGTGAGASGASSGFSGGNGVTDPGDRSYMQPKYGGGGSWRNFAGQLWCVGGGGGGNLEVADDPYFHWEPRSQTCSNGVGVSGGSGGWHNGTTNVLATPGVANTGGGGGGGSYDSSLSLARGGAAGADGLVAVYFTPSTGEISLSALAAVSYSGTTHTINLSRDNDTTDVTWTTSNVAVCTVSGGQSSATVTELAAGACEVSVVLGAKSPYARGTAATSFHIDKISRSTPTWSNGVTSVSAPFGSSLDLRPRLSQPGENYTFSTSGTANSCTVTGYTLTVGSVGDTCNVTPTLVGTSIYLDMVGTTALSVTVTKISQSALVLTSATSMNVDQTLTLSAAGGSGTGALSYHVVSAGNSASCVISDPNTGVLDPSSAGSCEVYAKRALSTNYDEVTSSHVIITVNKITQNLSWVSQPQAQYLAGQTYALQATASSQLAVTYSISVGLCTLSGTTVTFTGSGDCVILAGQSGDASYLEAVTISQTVSVGKINQTMTFSALANKSWGSLAFSLSATASSGLAITYSENNQTTNDACDVSTNGIVTIKNVGTCAITATQAGNSSYTSVTTTRLFNVTANQAGAPFIGSVSFGDRQLNASFFTPSYLGGGTVSAYELRAYELDGTLASTNTGCMANQGPTQSCSVIGLDNGKKYVLRVAAITQAGLGQLSASSSEIIPAANPEAVGNLIAIEGNGTLSLQWTEPTSFGGGNFFQYRIYWRAPGQQYQADGSPGAAVGSQSSVSYVITGLTNGVAYDVKIVTATSNNNVELQSNTAEVRQTPFTVPDAPAAVVALDNDNNVVVAWQPPVFDGGNPIDQYVVEKDGTAVCTITSATTTSCEVTKPSPGTTSVIEVRAGNDAGLSSAASTSITVQSVQGSSIPGIGTGSVSLPGISPNTPAPIVLDVSGSSVVRTNGLIRLAGTNFNLVEKVLIGDVEASFFVNSAELITIRIPIDVAADKPTITLQGAFGSRIFANLIEISVSQVSIDTKVTIGTFLGYAAVYTKNHEGKRLSMKIGNKWRVIDPLGANYTYNFTKVGAGRTVTVEVYIDRVLVQVKQIKIQ